MMTLKHDEDGMPVAVSLEYAARCLLLDQAVTIVAQDVAAGDPSTGVTSWLFMGAGWWRAGIVPETRPVLYRAKTLCENGVVEIVEFKAE